MKKDDQEWEQLKDMLEAEDEEHTIIVTPVQKVYLLALCKRHDCETLQELFDTLAENEATDRVVSRVEPEELTRLAARLNSAASAIERVKRRLEE